MCLHWIGLRVLPSSLWVALPRRAFTPPWQTYFGNNDHPYLHSLVVVWVRLCICRSVDADCTSLVPILAATVTRASQFMFWSVPSFGLNKIYRCREILQAIVGRGEFRAGNVARGMLLVMFSMIAVLLSFAGLSMDRAVTSKLSALKSQPGAPSYPIQIIQNRLLTISVPDMLYSEDSITGTPLVQSRVSHLHQIPLMNQISYDIILNYGSIKTVPFT